MNLDIEKNIPSGVMVRGIDTPTVFNVKITNLDRSAELKFMNFEGFVFEPESVKIKEDETKEIELKIYPKENFDYLGYYIFKYSIFSGEERIDEELILKLIKLENAFEVGANDFDPESSSLEIYIKNKENFNFENLNVKFSSAFFERE
jgi:hypothetical protein